MGKNIENNNIKDVQLQSDTQDFIKRKKEAYGEGTLDILKKEIHYAGMDRKMRKAKKALLKQGVEVTSETLTAQMCMDGNADKYSLEQMRKKADEYVKKNQKRLTIQVLFAITLINMAMLLFRYLWCIVFLDRIIVSNSSIYIVLSIVIPIITWVLMTTQDYFNFHNRKFLLFVLVIANAIATILQPIYTVVWDTLVKKIFTIEVNVAMTEEMVINLARIAVVLVMALCVTVLAKFAYPFLFTSEVKEKLMAFKLKHVVDLREDKEYAYDFKVIKDIKTGVSIVVKEIDRFTHFLLLGASGTGKTSSIYTPQITQDINTKIKNVEMQKRAVLRMIQKGYVTIKEPFKKFHKKYFVCIPEKQAEFDEIFTKYRDCGITVVAPNNDMNEDILSYASARGIWVNNLDPSKKKATHPYERLVGMNPFYLPKEYADISVDDEEAEEERVIRIAENANNFADALTAINEMAGTGDQYFTDVNTTVTSNIATIAMINASIQHKQVDIEDIFSLINDFALLKPIVQNLEEHFSMRLPDYKMDNKKGGPRNQGASHKSFDDLFAAENRQMNQAVETMYGGLDEKTKRNPYAKTLLTVKARLQKDSKMDEHAEGLRNLLGKLIQDPRVTRVLVPRGEIIDFNEILANNEITVVNTALAFGQNTSTCFGQLFILNFNSAVLRRPKDTRTPHFFYEDETARYLSNTIDTMATLYRQFKVSCMFALQGLSQPEKAASTKYLKDVLLSVGTLIVFGRTSALDSETVSKMGGQERYEMVQKTTMRTSILTEDPHSSTSERTTPDQMNVVEAQDVRFRDFQELTVITCDEGRVLPARIGKAAFVPREDFEPIPEMIEREKKWMMVWRERFPKTAQVVPVELETITPPKEQQSVKKAVERQERMSMHVTIPETLDTTIVEKEQLRRNLATPVTTEVYDEDEEEVRVEEDCFEFIEERNGTEERIKIEGPVENQAAVLSQQEKEQSEEERAYQEYLEYQQRASQKATEKGAIL